MIISNIVPTNNPTATLQTLDPSSAYILKLACIDDNINLNLNGIDVLSYTDLTPLLEGTVSLSSVFTNGNADRVIRIDDLKLSTVTGSNPAYSSGDSVLGRRDTGSVSLGNSQLSTRGNDNTDSVPSSLGHSQTDNSQLLPLPNAAEANNETSLSPQIENTPSSALGTANTNSVPSSLSNLQTNTTQLLPIPGVLDTNQQPSHLVSIEASQRTQTRDDDCTFTTYETEFNQQVTNYQDLVVYDDWEGGTFDQEIRIKIFPSTSIGNTALQLPGNIADGAGFKLIQREESVEIHPQLSPDGTRVVFSSDCSGDFKLYLLDLRTFEVKQLTKTTGVADTSPSWSPDGTKITFVSGGAGNTSKLYMIDAFEVMRIHHLNV